MVNNLNLKLYCLRYNTINEGCDPNKCTALKLKKLGLLKLIRKIEGKIRYSMILDPFSKEQVIYKDRDIILKKGLVVIDCSWNKLLNIKRITWKNSRKLPSLIAANPTNYGKWEQLSSAEAISAALFITGFNDFARLILSKFSWGNEFIRINNF